MSESAEPRINPDPPYAPGTPQPPDLDVDVEQFLDEDERRRHESEEPGEEPTS
ncbi:hypothetical protein JOF41_001414 [Saccharothrix coeruleofusca]|uniref:hypothetical protein n=1 Tax=Saccharothrix coeruleofusca TaxID=33919 RepID=UPI001AEA8DDC|nr:hypothetical protein [Saccharothrix coeruleofusca]MBP2335236.1 hypothetical protein [Saccharothrix coeruleofusca]